MKSPALLVYHPADSNVEGMSSDGTSLEEMQTSLNTLLQEQSWSIIDLNQMPSFNPKVIPG